MIWKINGNHKTTIALISEQKKNYGFLFLIYLISGGEKIIFRKWKSFKFLNISGIGTFYENFLKNHSNLLKIENLQNPLKLKVFKFHTKLRMNIHDKHNLNIASRRNSIKTFTERNVIIRRLFFCIKSRGESQWEPNENLTRARKTWRWLEKRKVTSVNNLCEFSNNKHFCEKSFWF